MTRKDIALGLLIALLCCGISLLLFCPRFYLWNPVEFYDFPECNRAIATLLQAKNPTADLVPIGGNDVIRWRLLVPTLAYHLKLSNSVIAILPFVFSYLLVAGATLLVLANTKKLSAAICAGALTATCGGFFTSTGFLCYFDSLLALMLLGASFGRSRVGFFALCALAPWVDERFILALPLVFWVRAVLQRPLIPMLLPMGVALAPYLALRVYAYGTGDFTEGYLKAFLNFDHDPKRLLLGLWEGLRFGWVGVLASLIISPQRLGGWLVVGASVLAHLTIAGDYSRSMVVFVPVMLLGVIQLATRARLWLWVVWTMALLNFLTPANIAFRAFVVPLFNLDTQLKIKDNILAIIRARTTL